MRRILMKKDRLVIYQLVLFCFLVCFLSGCVLTKIVSVPMRVAGAVISVIPVAGNTAHEAIDEAAEAVDELPL